MRLTREEVFALIGGEMDYARKYDEKRSRFPDSLGDKDKPVEVWLLWMEEYLAKARAAATADYDKTAALAHLRSALSLGVNCAVYHGMPPRQPKPSRETDPPQHAFGALPPPDTAWQTGKTVATIDFVREAEKALSQRTDLDTHERHVLRTKIDMLKSGEESLGDAETIDRWLEALRDHHP